MGALFDRERLARSRSEETSRCANVRDGLRARTWRERVSGRGSASGRYTQEL